MGSTMKFAWQQSRGEALYVEQETKRIHALVHWKDDNRLCIEAQYVGPGEPQHLGMWADEIAAKKTVEIYVASQNPMTKAA